MNLPHDFYTRPSTDTERTLLQLTIEWEWIKREQARRWAELIEKAPPVHPPTSQS